MAGREQAEYVLPLRWSDDAGLDELTAYLRELSDWIDVTVVDGSDPALFAAHAREWATSAPLVRHLPVAVARGKNGKVRGVLTGLEAARHEAVILADDDVRYDRESLASVVAALQRADLVRPQNFFDPRPWHARWDTGRTLLNRAVESDYPGTYGVRRALLRAAGGYDPDVLFENLEMERTVRAAGGTIQDRPDIYVARRPPSTRHFLSQRVRQAYDSWAQPGRLVGEAAILPLGIWAARRPLRLAALTGLVLLLAERGRRRAGGSAVFPPSSTLWAVPWVCERGVAAWAAILLRLRGGVIYGDGRLMRAANSTRTIARRMQPPADPSPAP
ncbi:glycosyltransferase [Leucobacter tenebrionis]|uniref:glycosyltransferase n=1 Tax=Leucobacter tenebrionis TaxID=2873270 RepID=UPI001CA72985|nr:glycosyltransferase family 2 protein [Leucobacter tenebrionis]QZY51787.1 glycosyltransferase family 2 protein [Leucobacter tenebrionis]